MNQPRNAIVFGSGSLGDFLMASYLARMLYGNGFERVSIPVRRNHAFLAGLVAEYPFIEVPEVSRTAGAAWLLGAAFCRQAVVLQPTLGRLPLRLKLIAWLLSRVPGSTLIGFKDAGPLCGLYSKILTYDTDRNYADTMRTIARELDTTPADHFPTLAVPEVADALVSRGLEAGKYVVFHPGASAAKRAFGVKESAELLQSLAAAHPFLQLVLSGGPGEEGIVDAIASASGQDVTRAIDIPSAEYATLVRHAALFIGADTGTTHLACFLGAPTLEVAHNATANWLCDYAPNATVLYKFADEPEARTDAAHRLSRSRGQLRPFDRVPAAAVIDAAFALIRSVR